jgi:hypothetical protein
VPPKRQIIKEAPMNELWSSKVYLIDEQNCPEKLAAQCGKDLDIEHVQELMALSREEMESRLANALLEIERAKKEVAENEKYKQAKQDVKYFDDALKEKVNPLKAVTQLMLWKLEETDGSSDWES